MKKFITAIALAALIVPAAFAFQHGHGRAQAEGFGHGGHAARILAQLNLTAEQKAQIKAIRDASHEQNKALFESFHAKVAEYRQLRKANDPNAEAAKSALQPLADQVKAVRKATRDQILAVLTPEQRTQAEQFRGRAAAFARGVAMGHRQAVFAQLNLTDDQKQQLKAIRESSRAQNQQLMQMVHAKMAQFRELKKADDPKADAVKAELEALKPQVKAARQAARDQMLSVLTAEQRAQLDQLRAHRSRR